MQTSSSGHYYIASCLQLYKYLCTFISTWFGDVAWNRTEKKRNEKKEKFCGKFTPGCKASTTIQLQVAVASVKDELVNLLVCGFLYDTHHVVQAATKYYHLHSLL